MTHYAEVARNVGLDPQRMLREVGLTLALLDDPDRRVPFASVVRLLENSARMSGCATFGLRMAESRQLSDFGAVSLLLSHQCTLRDALKVAIEYQHLLNESLALHISEEAGDTVILREEVVTEYADGESRQAMELALAILFRMCAALLGANWRPYSVNFTSEAPADLQPFARLFGRTFGCRLEFGSEFNGVVCSTADLDRPNPSADPTMARYAERFLKTIPGSTEILGRPRGPQGGLSPVADGP